MYKLQLENVRFHRVSAGQDEELVRKTFSSPVVGSVFEGAVVVLAGEGCTVCRARVGDDYASVARRFGLSEERLRAANGGKILYPTCPVCIPPADET